jgi:hypothetical protein
MARRSWATDAAELVGACDRALAQTAGTEDPRRLVLTLFQARCSDTTLGLVQCVYGPLAAQLANLAVLAEVDLDRAVDGIVRIAAVLAATGGLKAHAEIPGRGAVALAEAQVETLTDAIEGAFRDADLDRAQEARVRPFLAARLREIAENQDREGAAIQPHDRGIVAISRK